MNDRGFNWLNPLILAASASFSVLAQPAAAEPRVTVAASFSTRVAPAVPGPFGPAGGPSQAFHLITEPTWAHPPLQPELDAIYPPQAVAAKATGSAQIECEIGTDGRARQCQIAAEGPKSLGFGEAALRALESFRMRPATRDGRPVAGGWVAARFTFSLTADAPGGPTATSGDASGPTSSGDTKIALAERLARDTSLGASEALRLQKTSWNGGAVPPAWRRALEEASARSAPEYKQTQRALADAYSRRLTVEQLRGAIAFFESPLGRSFEHKYLLAVPRPPDDLTPAEIEAVRTFAGTADGSAFATNARLATRDVLPTVKAWGEALWQRAQTIHCRETHDCTPPWPVVAH